MTREEIEIIEAIESMGYDRTAYPREKVSAVISMAIEALKDRPQGEWIEATGMMPPEFHGHHYCSECGNFANMEPPFGNREDLSKFCPKCGADMRGGTDD